MNYPIKFSVSNDEADKIKRIVERAMTVAREVGIDYPSLDAHMDITACHANGCPLDLDALLAAKDTDFTHDVFGIRRHINRNTGLIEDGFTPRYARQ